MRGGARTLFAATLLILAGGLNIIYGIGSLDNASFLVNDKRYIFSNLHTMGWVLIILGIVQLTGGFSLIAGNVWGRAVGILGATLGAVGAFLSIGGKYPWWSLLLFFLCLYILHGILIYGEDDRATRY